MKMELRTTDLKLSKSDGDLVVSGYVNRPGELSAVLGATKKFREKIEVGAFKRALANAPNNIDFLAEHDSNKVLSSQRNSSLELREDAQGLFMSAKISPTSYGRDYFQLITDGLISSMSFGFRALRDSWSRDSSGMAIRTVHELSLFEISAVKNPAYDSSILSARSIDIEETLVPKILETQKTENERGHLTMEMEMEKRNTTNKEFEQYLRGKLDTRSLTTTTEGKALIPENVADSIVLKMEEISPAFRQARRLNSVEGSLSVPIESDSITGGFFGEGEDIIEQNLNFEHVKLAQKRLGAAVSLTQQLANDSGVNIVDYTQNILSRRVAKTAEHAIFSGDGVNEFKGILSEEGVASVDVSGAIEMDNFVDMQTAIHPDFVADSAFYMNRTLYNAVAKIKDQNSHYFLQNSIVNGKLTYTLLGSPVFVTEGLPATTPAVFANMAEAYTILVKKEMTMLNVANDTKNALRGSMLVVLDGYMDGAVTNKQAISKLTVTQ